MKPKKKTTPAFTRVDLLAILSLLTGVALLTGSALAGLRPNSAVSVCASNLRQIGGAIEVWSTDHDGVRPWWTMTNNGGTYGASSGLRAQPYFHYTALSNQLGTPRVLVCPSDHLKHAAKDFGSSPEGGFNHGNFRNRAISYVLCPEARSAASAPSSWLILDRNIRYDGFSSCHFGIVNINTINVIGSSSVSWTNSIHYPIGNILLNDGRVLQSSITEFRQLRTNAFNDNGANHFLPTY